MHERKNSRVLVGLSGGVDSSVAAALLKAEGYEVEGAFIITWQAPWLPCTWPEERRDAMRVAAALNIPFRTIDLSLEYERDVVQYLVSEYRAGRTPNPDVMCNRTIKFGAFFDRAMAEGYDYVATGHYAQVRESRVLSLESREGDTVPVTSHYSLATSVDTAKDQTYFLWTLTQHHLAHTLFPIGGFEKSHVRELATSFGLPTARKKDSQGVCFLGQVDMQEFLAHYIPPKEGRVLDQHGVPIGVHPGAVYFTLGQRHGFTVRHTSSNTPRLFVIAKDVGANTITVAPTTTEHMQVEHTNIEQHIALTDVHWISGRSPDSGRRTPGSSCTARLRYRQQLFPVELTMQSLTTATVRPTVPQPFVPSGQSLVLYAGDTCLGGGVIA